jgi:methylated-DNA-[protein]-cysteine S-methyltransferase
MIEKNSNKNKINDYEIYELLKKIPIGKLTTYGDIAKHLGKPGQSRTIGKILNKNKNPINIPCHRVINSNGNLGGYKFGKELKKILLKREGMEISKDKIVNFNKFRENLEK